MPLFNAWLKGNGDVGAESLLSMRKKLPKKCYTLSNYFTKLYLSHKQLQKLVLTLTTFHFTFSWGLKTRHRTIQASRYIQKSLRVWLWQGKQLYGTVALLLLGVVYSVVAEQPSIPIINEVVLVFLWVLLRWYCYSCVFPQEILILHNSCA